MNHAPKELIKIKPAKQRAKTVPKVLTAKALEEHLRKHVRA
jgi:hypothetical protein